MSIDKEDVAVAKGVLLPDETVELTARQRRVGPGGSLINPSSIIATDKRVIIINRVNIGIRMDYEVIPYRQITSVRLERGVVSSSVFIRVQGFDTSKGLLEGGKQEGEIDGLNVKNAEELVDTINKHMLELGNMGPTSTGSATSTYKFCPKCGAKNQEDARFCVNCGKVL